MSTSGTLVILIAIAIQKLSLRDPYQPTDLRHSIKAAINDEKPIKDYLTKYRQSELQIITG